ncbi:MAG: YqgE/AlgH family protein [Deltaproteobacteria bacterium]|nr:YqgE/AlgH family protein [Deltaproteobacteria bacterium]
MKRVVPSLAPSLLVSVPHLRDPNFDHSVVLLLEHDAEGSMGLVINRQTDHSMSDFCALQDLEYRGPKEAMVFVGGPVEPTQGFVLHGGAPPAVPSDVAGREVVAGIWFGADMELLRRLTREGGTLFRLLVGYAGWAPGQLDAEIAAGAWIPRPATPELVFHASPAEVWSLSLRDLGIDPRTIVKGGAAPN